MSRVDTSDLVGVTVEEQRLADNRQQRKYWLKWGPYLSERSWATVREDYSFDGDAWRHFPFEQANARVFRWGEDGIFGVSDNRQLVCLNVGMWNGRDELLKERMFGLTGPQGNHGEDCKELYYYLDNLPSHAYMKALYKYPFKRAFPYQELVAGNEARGYAERELEVYELDGLYREAATGDTPYYDVVFEMAKGDENPDDLNFRITVHNRSKTETGELYLMPQVFFRNTWAWNTKGEESAKPRLHKSHRNVVTIDHAKYGTRRAIFAPSPGWFDSKDSEDIEPELLFTENESNLKKLFNEPSNPAPYTKDAFDEYVVHGNTGAVNPAHEGTKAAALYHFPKIPPNDYVTVRYKFTDEWLPRYNEELVIDEEAFDAVFDRREQEAENFYWRISPVPIPPELRKIQRQAFAGLLWSKQFYHFVHEQWYEGDPLVKPRPPQDRANGRNKQWKHMYADDILSLPDKWEYPFFASWDTAFHCTPLAMIDPDFAKRQLDLLTREWYMHPNGQIPAYEWNFSDVNPPVHAWAVYRVFKIERNIYHREDRLFLERVFQKLLLNFTWWVNRKDSDGNNVFEGGFLGLDNIGVFNRSEPLPTGGKLEQADSTGWMAFFCLQMLNIALELAKENPVYEDIASKFFEHFILISDAMSFSYGKSYNEGEPEKSQEGYLWNDEDKFYYDVISWGGPFKQQLPIRSLVGLIPLYASMTLEPGVLDRFKSFKKRVDWFIEHRRDIFDRNIASMEKRGVGERLLLSLVNKERLQAILRRMLDETEFLSDYGIRSLSKYHEEHPFEMEVGGMKYVVKYLPGESDSGMFGGNSNWRGPIWFPTNFLLVESLQKFFLYYGSDFKVECPTGSGEYLNLAQVAEEISHRLIHLFVPDANGLRAAYYGDHAEFLSKDEHFKDLIPFFEYFDGDTGRGLGASHQCGWTSLVAKWIHDAGASCIRLPRTPRSHTSIPNLGDATPTEHSLLPKLSRRKSGRSLINLTGTHLELTEEEKILHTMGTMNSNSATTEDSYKGEQTGLSSPKLAGATGSNSEHGIDSAHMSLEGIRMHAQRENSLIAQLKERLKNLTTASELSADEEEELETH
ncbi:AaceriAFL167Cp [[Ashbya] aceris (nom. inval.)]|nr:AaceriAFL167Cp [[Ashbya] aceris (nom. inval.)]